MEQLSLLAAKVVDFSQIGLDGLLHLDHGLFERYKDVLLPKKAPKQKTCQIPRKRVILLSSIKIGPKSPIKLGTSFYTSFITQKLFKNCLDL